MEPVKGGNLVNLPDEASSSGLTSITTCSLVDMFLTNNATVSTWLGCSNKNILKTHCTFIISVHSLDLPYIQTGSYHTAFIIFSTSFFLDSHITLSSYLSKILLISFRFLS